MNEKEINESFVEEWNRIGVYYELHTNPPEITFWGSKMGIDKFATIIESCTERPPNSAGMKVDYLGPYAHLQILIGPSPMITIDTIAGKETDLRELAKLIRRKAKQLNPNDHFILKDEYSMKSLVSLKFNIMQGDFEPARMA